MNHTDRKRRAVGAEMHTFSKNGMSRATYVWNTSPAPRRASALTRMAA